MPETLPTPEIIERGSEKTVMIVGVIVAVVVIIAQLVFLGISEADVAEKLTWLAPVNAGLGWAAKLAWEWIKSRAPKHHAMALRLMAEVQKSALANGPGVPSLPLSSLPLSSLPGGQTIGDPPPSTR